MKNVHLLPTDKPTRLLLSGFGTLFLTSPMEFKSSDTYQNIYITSDEEIKEGWYITDNHIVSKLEDITELDLSVMKTLKVNKKVFKIILTTDQDLIKDGVQAIDDEFLEWFCLKNGEIDFVEVISIEDEKN
jgi:hypothetical protein